LILLNNSDKKLHQAILLTLSGSWHLRNDGYHGKGEATIEYCARNLSAYVRSLNTNPNALVVPDGADAKGKKHVIVLHIDEKIERRATKSESCKC
jgi:hypothetical protein